ncbi:MAG: hypothetical protein JWQ52_2006 [Phenylobacterium sp.]|jgi:hypothetical protein|nr:hypothetical protein [Phenylobacterium sp.]
MALSTRTTGRPTLGATRARQGRLGRPVLWVLLFSLLLVVLGFLAAYTWKSGDFTRANSDNGRPKAGAPLFDSPPPGAADRQNYQQGAPLAPKNGGNPSNPGQ